MKTTNAKNTFYPVCFCAISRLPIFDFQRYLFTQFCRSLLYKMYEAHRDKVKDFTIEFYLTLLFHHLSYSSEIQNEVEVQSIRSRETFIRYRNYKAVGLTLPNFTVQALLENIRPKQIMEIAKLLLLERKVIFVRDNCTDNALIIESLLMLLLPL